MPRQFCFDCVASLADCGGSRRMGIRAITLRKHSHSKANAIAKEAATVAVKIVAAFIFVTSVSRLLLFTHSKSFSEPDPPVKLKKLAEIPQTMC